jgi:hypothetical protein
MEFSLLAGCSFATREEIIPAVHGDNQSREAGRARLINHLHCVGHLELNVLHLGVPHSDHLEKIEQRLRAHVRDFSCI